MAKQTFTKITQGLQGEIQTLGDKSISHRAIMLGSLAEGTTVIDNILHGADIWRTIHHFQELGVNISLHGTNVTIKSKGVRAFQEPTVPLYFGNSGTTARLMLGILASMPFY